MALALFSQILGLRLWTYCLKKLSAGFGSLVGLLIPALSAVEGWGILSENIELWTLVSFLVIFFGMYLALCSRSAIKSGV
ncbi:MAG: EamA family transporter [Moorea sp. SIO4A3]|nr:EamA family transporter [Moorena sp. SIO4A3]